MAQSDVPAIVIVAVNVEDLFAFYAEHTAYSQSFCLCFQ